MNQDFGWSLTRFTGAVAGEIGGSNGVRVDIKTKKAYFGHATNFFRMRLCAVVLTDSQRNPRPCESGLVTPL